MNLNSEIRCDYIVTEKRKAIWACQLEMLKKIIEVCKKHDIQFFAVAGTMLGAVRHKGYIPWDDDVDIGLLRKDFNKLLEVGPAEFEYPLFFQTATNEDEYYSPLARLRDSRTTAIVNSGSHDDRCKKCNNGIYIDIFPLDSLTDNKTARKIQFFEIRFLGKLLRERVYQESDKLKDKITHNILSSVLSKKAIKKLYSRYSKVCSRYNDRNFEKVALLSGSVYNKTYYWYKSDITDVIWVDFEDIKIPIPKGYKRCLEIQYGNYLELPPVEKRGQHHEEAVIFDPFVDYLTYQKRNGFIEE